jgi:hypothetical protein
MDRQIIRGVRVATSAGIMPASVHIAAGKIVAVAGYEELPREAAPEELGKSVLMAALGGISHDKPTAAQIVAAAEKLAQTWTPMRERGEPIEMIAARLCQGEIVAGATADFTVWNPELVVIGSRPVLYGQLRQVILAGRCLYRDGAHLDGVQ